MSVTTPSLLANERRLLKRRNSSLLLELKTQSISINQHAEVNPIIPIRDGQDIILLDVGGTNARVIHLKGKEIISSTSYPLDTIHERAKKAGHEKRNLLTQLGFGLAQDISTNQAHIGAVWSNNFRVIPGQTSCSCIGGSDKGEFFAQALADGVDVANLIGEGFRSAGIAVESFQAVNDTTALAGLHQRAVATFVGSTGANTSRVKRNQDGSIKLYNLENGRKLLLPSSALYQSDPEPGQSPDQVQIQQLCSGKWLPGVFLRKLQSADDALYTRLAIREKHVPKILSHILGDTEDRNNILANLDSSQRDIVKKMAAHIAARGGAIAATMIVTSLQADNYRPHSDGQDVIVVDSSQAEYLRPYKRALSYGLRRAYGDKLSLVFASRQSQISPPACGLMNLMTSS